MITAYGDAETKRKALENGAEALLTKPIDFAMLRNEIDIRVERAARTFGMLGNGTPAVPMSSHFKRGGRGISELSRRSSRSSSLAANTNTANSAPRYALQVTPTSACTVAPVRRERLRVSRLM